MDKKENKSTEEKSSTDVDWKLQHKLNEEWKKKNPLATSSGWWSI